MTDKPKPWPYAAADARDRAAEAAVEAITTLTETEIDCDRLRRLTRAITDLYSIVRLLESVGAKTRP